jgi:hypothetical protein
MAAQLVASRAVLSSTELVSLQLSPYIRTKLWNELYDIGEATLKQRILSSGI